MIIHLYVGFMFLLGIGLLEGIRHLLRRERIARGIRP
jgi:hypothetical protein